ncbi:MAG: TlyA family rRNA (cytidine-2'-O)-methyltransferase [Planctomycetes bacterium]|nr:TlyA family rRNA (cytidine-2'-O)-methyltransferase [Planctomycetota bacterium]
MGGDRRGGYVSRGGLKLEAALEGFGLNVTGLCCADFGCHAGGFTECLLRHGAAMVYAVDTGYGVLDYRLRTDRRVVVMERTNALYCPGPGTVDLVTIDVGWTCQRLVIPAALRWLGGPGVPDGRIISLVKPHYELDPAARRSLLKEGVLEHAEARAVAQRVVEGFEALGAQPLAMMISPLGGAKSARKTGGIGNREYLVLAGTAPLEPPVG